MSTETDKIHNISDNKAAETIDSDTGNLAPTRRRIDLSNLRDVRLELANVYRQMDSEEIATQDGTRRAYVLKLIHDVIVSAELERRIQELEDQTPTRSGFRSARALN